MNGRLLPDAYSCKCGRKYLVAFNIGTCRKDIALQVSQFLASSSKTDVLGRLVDSLVPVSPAMFSILILHLEYYIIPHILALVELSSFMINP